MTYEYITSSSSPNFTRGANSAKVFGFSRRILGITIHHWGDPADGATFDSVVRYLCRKNGNTSAHYVIQAGKCSCIIAPENVAWHAGHAKGNATTLGLELNPRASEADYETAGEVIADIWRAYGKIPLFKHSDFKATKCPGRWNLYKLEKIAELHYLNKKSDSPVKPKPAPKKTQHLILKGETLYSIAKKYGTTVKKLASLNGIKHVNNITAGKKININ